MIYLYQQWKKKKLMKVVSRHVVAKKTTKKAPNKKVSRGGNKVIHHPKYGTSKLETYFEENFIKKLGLKYVYQYETDIGRFYDFAIFTKSGSMVLVELDGSYFHADPRVVSEEQMTPMHKRNKRVDGLKDKWALIHGIPLIRIWEKDVKDNPKMVMDELKKRLHVIDNETKLLNEKKKRHKNLIK